MYKSLFSDKVNIYLLYPYHMQNAGLTKPIFLKYGL